jgi:hypothetical protein
VFIAFLAGCDGESAPIDGGPLDAGATDAGSMDGGSMDAGLDGAMLDSGTSSDAGLPDATTDAAPSMHHVVVRLIGRGSGRVEGGSIDCDEAPGATCDMDVEHGAHVHFDAYPDESSVLDHWSIASCASALACDLDIDADVVITVEFARRPVGLRVDVSGEGTVRVTPGDECAGSCDSMRAHGDVIALEARPSSGHRFAGWTDACAATTGSTCVLTLEADTLVGAIFAPIDDGLVAVRAGTGQGRIVSMPAGIDCGDDCTEHYPRGTRVTLTASATEGSDFEGWSGDCAGLDAQCAVDVDGGRVAVASFRLRRYALAVAHAGDGVGRVTADVGMLDCGPRCTADYGHGTRITLTAVADPSSTFVGWTGACTGASSTCEVSMIEARSVTAAFALRRYAFDVTREGTGTGRVQSSPSGIDCGASCTALFGHGTRVTLTAMADASSTFAGWSGACAGPSATCELDATEARSVRAAFAIRRHTVTTARSGDGTGAIASMPSGIACGSDCTETWNHGTSVTLTASATTGSDFDGWTGACAGSSASCTLELTSSIAATAAFRLRRYVLGVTREGDGTGRVSADVGGLDCGSSCSATYGHGTTVTLTAAADASSTFTGWTGACAGMASTCVVSMNEARTVTATFALRRYELSVARTGTGTGRVQSTPSGIDCGSACTTIVGHGTRVTLTAIADASSTFDGWTGACTGLSSVCELDVTAVSSVTARFAMRRHTLTVVRTGSGSGAITSEPAGIACGSDCTEVWDHGTTVTLTALADDGSRFVAWTTDDGVCTGSGACTITLDRSREVRAELRGFEPTLLSTTDRDPGIRMRDDALAVDFYVQGGARSDRSIAPGSGVFYFEAHRLTGELGSYGAGVATASVPIVGSEAYVGSTDQSFGASVNGGLTYASGWAGSFPSSVNDTYGFVVDYRGATPTVYFIARNFGASPAILRTQSMPAVTSPLYIYVAGSKRTIGNHIEVNPGNDTVNFPFTYDPAALLRAAGHAAVADALVLGWGQTHAGAPDDAPVITTSSDLVVAPGTPVTVTATATDAEDGVLTASLRWELLSSPHYAGRVRANGGSFTFTPTSIGRHPARVEVRDSAGQLSQATVMIRVEGTLAQPSEVRLVPDARTGAGVVLSSDGLSARWTGFGKMGVRANQSNYGQFWYFEISRLIAPANQGGGLIIGEGNLNPYDWVDVAPSCSINTTGASWRNIIWQGNFPSLDANTYTHYGFAVDYRGLHPRVYVIVGGAVVRELYLDDVWVEIYPVLYGNPQGTAAGSFDEAINFGATPFAYDPTAALVAHGVDVSAFEPGWGDANTD